MQEVPVPRRSAGAFLLALTVASALAPAAPAAAAESEKALLARCASFVKRLSDRGARTGIPRPDLYEGLTGWLATKAGVKAEEVRASGRRATPDLQACAAFGLAPEPLLALEAIIDRVPAARVRPAIEACLAALRVIEDSADAGRSAARGASMNESRMLGKVLGYLAKDKKPLPGAVEAQAESLRREAGGDLRSNAVFGSALSACGPIGVDVALLARIRGSL